MPSEDPGASTDAGRLEHALALAYRYLNRRDRTVAEMRRHLEGKRVDAGAIDGALGALLGLGHVDDARFARMFAEDKRHLEGWGDDRIRQNLHTRGIVRELIEAALGDGPRELERALEVLRRRFPAPPAERRERDRALALLLRKGYDCELALDALRAHSRGHADG